jgi:RNA polymerase sigma factor (sigma-70 family)
LDRAAADPDLFEAECLGLIEALDADETRLEITSPDTWRCGGRSASSTSFVQQFRADVDAIKPLGREEEARLARRIEFARLRYDKTLREEGPTEKPAKGSRKVERRPSARVNRRGMELHALRTEMVERNLYLVLINVERYAQTGGSRLDLIQEGCVSLFRAVDGFDWRRGLLFRTYAVHWLNQAFRNYLYNNTHTVRIPIYLQKALKHIDQVTIRLGNPKATPEEIAASSDLNEGLIAAAQRAARGSYSIDVDHADEEGGSRLRDMLVDEQDADPYSTRLEEVSLQEGLERAIASLGERERLVIGMRFGIGHDRQYTLAEVAKRLGVSVERIRQIQVRALAKLNTPTLRRELDPFLN